ncbi:MAG: hypothetical protein Q8P41_00800 [Pseudomonadota bacterium]|nr:hypothetical protein [Pseudomonadota bacterium]
MTCALALLYTTSCDGDKPDDPVSLACPGAAAETIDAGDANGDGAVDLADAVVILRAVADGGAAPACTAAIDLVPDEQLDLDDAFSLLIHLFEGGFSLPTDVDCAGAVPLEMPFCSPLEARFSETGTVELRADTLDIEAWSLAVTAEGCTVSAATTAGTLGASIVDTPAGLRDLGYDATFLAEGGAVSAVVLGFMDAPALPAGAWSPVLALTVEQGDTCDCTLRLDSTVTALGEPVESLAVASGGAWALSAEATIDACAGR